MKKYIKPELFYENFQLSHHIAVCEWDMNATIEMNCSAQGSEDLGNDYIFLFMSGNPACNMQEDPESYCEEVQSDAYGLFNS